MQKTTSGNRRLRDLIKRFTKDSDQKKINLNKKFVIFFFFLLLSILFWFLTALNKEYVTSISYPVRYIRFPENKILVNDVPDRLELSVNASGFTLLSYQLRSRLTPIIFDVNSFSLNTFRDDPSSVYILSSYAKDGISRQLSSEIEILDINPDSLIFKFAGRAKKLVRVNPILNLSFEKQFMQVGKYTIEPDSITVSGPEVIIDSIELVETEELIISGINESFDLEVKIKPINKVDLEPVEVWLQVPVEKFTEANLKIPIEVVNLPDSFVLRTFPGEVNITCQVGLSAYETLQEHLFRAVVDYSDAGTMLGSKLQVNLIKVPEFIQSLNYTPKSVEYILER
ncbi:CdaR family protein [Bacteroidota bacterium]